jgi:hypothetical protein
MLIPWLLTPGSRSVYVVCFRGPVVELFVLPLQRHWQQQLQDRLYLPRLSVYYHCFAVCLSYPAAHRPLWLAVESSMIRLCMHFFWKVDQLQMHFGSRMFEVRQQVEHHVDDHLEPWLDIQLARLS